MEEFSVPPRRSPVKASIERALPRLTRRASTSGGRGGHKLGKAALDKGGSSRPARPAGRWYESTVDGAECTWGYVLAWEPPGPPRPLRGTSTRTGW